MIKGLENNNYFYYNNNYYDRLRVLNLTTLETRRVRGDLGTTETGTKSANLRFMNKNYTMSGVSVLWYLCKNFDLKIPNGYGNNNETLLGRDYM